MQMRTGGVYKNPNPIAHGVHTFPFFPRFPTLVELIVGGSVRGRARTWERSIGRDIKAGPWRKFPEVERESSTNPFGGLVSGPTLN